jgi:hypothetical protein
MAWGSPTIFSCKNIFYQSILVATSDSNCDSSSDRTDLLSLLPAADSFSVIVLAERNPGPGA